MSQITPDAWIERQDEPGGEPDDYEACPVCDRIACACEDETEQRDIANLDKPEPTTADPKPKHVGASWNWLPPKFEKAQTMDSWLPVPDIEQRDQDHGGNFTEDRIQANLDRYKDGPEHD